MADPRALSQAQFREAMAADGRLHAYAVLNGARIAGLAARLEQAGQAEWDCLWPGALPASARAQAPYLVRLRSGSAFSDWVLFRAQQAFTDGCLLVLSAADFLAVRRQLRELREARLPDGRLAPFAFMDPETMRLLLPMLDGGQLGALMGACEAWLLPDPQGWTRWVLRGAQLEQHAFVIES
ncbi:MAG: DUF4123 domain-containing protein [Pseudomonadota bacterium]|nr:DUF4123 domain-containing protein [Pseudomonadota bacterium]